MKCSTIKDILRLFSTYDHTCTQRPQTPATHKTSYEFAKSKEVPEESWLQE